jgi:hypothetical protein
LALWFEVFGYLSELGGLVGAVLAFVMSVWGRDFGELAMLSLLLLFWFRMTVSIGWFRV